MAFSGTYDRAKFYPAAPVIEVSLSIPSQAGMPSVAVQALLDSGADMTVIPHKLVDQLQLRLVDVTQTSSYDGVQREEIIYSVRLSVPSVGSYGTTLRVLSSKLDFVLLGRDVLNDWELLLDGKNQVLRIS
jgi:hypothetical protein